MKTNFILYKIERIEESGNYIFYLKEIQASSLVFTVDKNEAMRTTFYKAIVFSIKHNLARIPERFS